MLFVCHVLVSQWQCWKHMDDMMTASFADDWPYGIYICTIWRDHFFHTLFGGWHSSQEATLVTTNIFCPESRPCLSWTSVGRRGRGQCSMYGILKLIKPILQNIHCFRGQVNIQYYWLCLHIGKRETESIDVITSIIIIIFIKQHETYLF